MLNSNKNGPVAEPTQEESRTPLLSPKQVDTSSPKPEPLLIKIMEVAWMLNLGKTTVKHLDQTGRIPAAYKFGRAKRWRRDEIENWIREGMPTRERFEAMKSQQAKGGRR